MICPIVQLTKDLIKKKSITPDDAGCQTLLINRLKKFNFHIKKLNIDDTHNFWATHGNNGKTLIFLGHTDVVSPGNIKNWIHNPFESVISDNFIFGRGASDMKGAIAAMIIAAENFVLKYPEHLGKLAFLITSDEEGSGKNGIKKVIKKIIKNNERLDYCIVGEPTSSEKLGDIIKNGRRGSMSAYLTVYGIQGHVAYPNLIINPVHQIIPFLNELLLINWDKETTCDVPTQIQITNIKADYLCENIIPGKIFIQFNFRFNNEINSIYIKKIVEKLLKKNNLNFSIKWKIFANPFLTKKGKLMDVVLKILNLYNGFYPKIETSGGTSDGRFLAEQGAEVIELGPINKTIHKNNECINIKDIQKLSLIYQKIIEQLML
ncbi:succinyl-diaminopimelate desuccinylase [Candidatus Tachikawaea gelatinosa]|uniref:Succinyl-diaminopimelate desuccinylase n=1 Tax=Candidatus Tachikawaea gelatinosa TaxID=1410383 RepID=A0A090AK62_9ENTR|nr:succinyl-diaminopimelate desuccinylase [Candidatus Tachikawaea gelatinosa]BAP58818.1 succinyl-diaminopimelate desuccinylase [Candidatus Tachikawaea gelatinosa]